jgi:hypothetical protein
VSKAKTTTVLAFAVLMTLQGCSKEQPSAQAPAPTAPADQAATPQTPLNHPPARPVGEIDLTGIAKAEGGKNVFEVYTEKSELANQKVSVRGKVVKTNAGIMGKDWLHVRDGSGEEGKNDLTVTTTAKPLPNVGDTVLVTGTVVLDKDFGMGYQYPVLVEDAEVKIEAAAAK